MPITISINDAGQAVLEIADADAELHAYRFRLVPPGLSVWALEVTRADSDRTYRVEEMTPGRWDCSCDLQQKGKRGQKPCKHIRAGRLLKAWLNEFLKGDFHDRCGSSQRDFDRAG